MSLREDADFDPAETREETARHQGQRGKGPTVSVAFYGNLANNFYQIAKAVRRWDDVDAHLYIDSDGDDQSYPESDDPELRDRYPSWIHKVARPHLGERLLRWRTPLARELARYDVVVVSGSGPMVAAFSGKPVAFYATGGDLTVTPFPIEFMFRHPGLVPKVKALWFGAWQRREIRRCADLWVAPFEPFNAALRKLDIDGPRVSMKYFPLIIDTDRFVRQSSTAISEVPEVREIRSKFDFTVFHPSRFLMHASPRMRAAGQWKSNDTLIRAFARFVAQTRNPRAGLVFIDRPVSDAPDVAEAKRLIRALDIERNVLWLRPPNNFGFTRAELMAMYSACDVVADDFGAGWFGSIVLEGLAARRPVLCYVDENAMKRLYPWHPLLSDRTVNGLAELITKLAEDPVFRRERGVLGRDWVEKFHSPDSAGRVYVERIRELARGSD